MSAVGPISTHHVIQLHRNGGPGSGENSRGIQKGRPASVCYEKDGAQKANQKCEARAILHSDVLMNGGVSFSKVKNIFVRFLSALPASYKLNTFYVFWPMDISFPDADLENCALFKSNLGLSGRTFPRESYFCCMNPKAIIFDLGGVLMNLSYQKTAAAFRALGLKDFDSIYSQAQQSGLFDAFETGKLGPTEFRKSLREWLDPEIRDDQIDRAWNAMLLGMPADRINLLHSLKDRYRIFLLSNTNEIHLSAVFEMMRADHGFPDLSHLMEKQYYSCRMGMRKPEGEIFRHVIEEQGLNAGEVLFIDDSIQHIEGARSIGLRVHHLKAGEELTACFDEQFNIRMSGHTN